MLKGIWAARWYLILGLLTFLITLVLTMPLHFAWRMVAPHLSSLPVHIHSMSGTLWHGRVQLQVPELRDLGLLNTSWQLEFLPLLVGNAKINLSIDSTNLRLTMPLSLSSSHVDIQGADGYLNLQSIESLLRDQGTRLGGTVELQRLLASVDLNTYEFSELAGRIVYGGGPVTVLIDNKPVSATLPLLVGQLGREPERAALLLTTQEGDILLNGYLQPDGWAGMALRRRFVDLMGQTWPAKAEADTVIFEVSSKVL